MCQTGQNVGQSEAHYPGHGRIQFSTQLDVMDPTQFTQIPAYQVLSTKGELLTSEEDLQVGTFIALSYHLS